MNIYDCFMYFDEDLLLDLRLNSLDKYIKKFIITEATYTHNGSQKKLNFDINNFKKFIPLKLYLPSTIIKIEKSIRAINENLCWLPFLRNADLIAIMKSSLFVCIVY